MIEVLKKHIEDINKVFLIGVNFLNVARSLKSISLDLKLLAINGILQAAKIGNQQGQSLITLSGFLSDLPNTIAPELEELEKTSYYFSKNITECTISFRKFYQFTSSLENYYDDMQKNSHFLRNLTVISLKDAFEKSNQIELYIDDHNKIVNLKRLVANNYKLLEHVNEFLEATKKDLKKSRSIIERVQRNGFIARYMATCISIESSYLRGSIVDFTSLVQNINNMIDELNLKLDSIIQNINEGETLVDKTLNSRVIN
jgi:hypothetical protein